jgi:xanthine dehydrogenase small subunit
MSDKKIRFLLNDKEIALDKVRAEDTLLDFLRLDQRLCGTKEGCAEGDCGACTVLIGRLKAGKLIYVPVNSCIRFTGSLNACHVVTVEYLAGTNGALHPVQQAMVDEHGSQCGFCTPGFVMSLYALWMESANPSDAQIETALQGNLCRCTGYEAIMRAARTMGMAGSPAADRLVKDRETVMNKLAELTPSDRIVLGGDKAQVIVPASRDDLAKVLAEYPGARIVAGATDVGLWVTKHMRDIAPAVFIGHLDDLSGIVEGRGKIIIGATATYAEALEALSSRFTAFGPLIDRIGGAQIRAVGTVGGNIANGSPIGDTPPPLIALGATVALGSATGTRELDLADFFIDYGKQDRKADEFVESISVPLLKPGDIFSVYKISKRRDEDITASLAAFRLRLSESGKVEDIAIACGGMAATPKRASAVEAALMGKEWSEATITAAADKFEDDFSPITDMRASADYRMRVTKNLLRRFWLETQAGAAPVSLAGYAA